MRADRLLVLALHLETVVDPASFYMKEWKSYEGDDDDEAYYDKVKLLKKEGKDPPECGFVSCAMGHACLIPEFVEAGLQILGSQPVFETGTAYMAAALFFEIDFDSAIFLFKGNARENETPQETAGRIRKFVEDWRGPIVPTELNNETHWKEAQSLHKGRYFAHDWQARQL